MAGKRRWFFPGAFAARGNRNGAGKAALRNGGERGGEFGESGFALRLAEVEKAVGGLGGEGEAAAAIEKRDGTAESGFGECTDCGGRVCPIFFAAGAIDGGEILADVFPFGFKGGVAGLYGVGFFGVMRAPCRRSSA